MLKETAMKLAGLVGKEFRYEEDYNNLPCSWSTINKYMQIEVVRVREVCEVLENQQDIVDVLNGYAEMCGYIEEGGNYRYEIENNKIVGVNYYNKKVIKGFKD